MLSSALSLLIGAALAPACASPAGAKPAPTFFLERVPSGEADTIVSVHVCLSPPKDGLGSYNLTLTYDSAQMRAKRVDVSGGGLQVANPDLPGTIRIAGASPAGFRAGSLATIAFRAKRGRSLGHIRLTLTEANAPSGSSVLTAARVAGYPASDRSLGVVQTPIPQQVRGEERMAPTIDSLSPRSARIDAEGVIEIAIHGKGFAATGNTVLFDAATVGGVASERDGTIIRFVAPSYLPAKGSSPSRRVTAGRYAIKVRTSAGTSNAVSFVARDEER